MAQIKLDLSGLDRLQGADYDSKKERRAILDFLYQLTEQLRYWQNNLEEDNLSEAFRDEYAGLRSTVEGVDGNISSVLQTADEITLRVEKVEEGFAEIVITADGALIAAQNAEGKVAKLQVQVDKIETMVGSLNGPANYVQWDEPENPEAGDIWAKTGKATWAEMATMLWQDVGTQPWAYYFNTLFKTYIWDGEKWELLTDREQVLDQSTRITQTEEAIELTAQRMSVVEGRVQRNETQILENADEIKLRAKQSDLVGLQETVGEISVKNDEIDLEVKELKSNGTDKLRNASVNIDLDGVDIEGGELNMRAGTAMNVESGGKLSIKSGAALEVEAQNFVLTEDGSMTASGATLEEASIQDATMQRGSIQSAEIREGTVEDAAIKRGSIEDADITNANITNASVSGNLVSGGFDVLTTRHLVVSSTEPTSPQMGMVWAQPVNVAAATFAYQNTAQKRFDAFATAHAMENAGSPTSGSGAYKWRFKLPYRVTAAVKATRYLTVTVGGMVLIADAPLALDAGSHVLDMSGTMSKWMGDRQTVSLVLDLHYMGSDDGTLHSVHRVDAGEISLTVTAGGEATDGWSSANVRIFNG